MSSDKSDAAEAQAQGVVALQKRVKEIQDAARVAKMSPHEFEEWSSEQIARGDAERRREYLQQLREERERGARLRGHGV